MSKKTTQLKKLIQSKDLEFIMEAHNGLSAKLVEEAGFKGIWGSGLSLSASLGVRDNNEASWTQIVDVLEFMSDATSIPILMDGDTGFGNFNNVRRLVKKLEQRDIAGVCIEDKLFPKTNSFINGEAQVLADMTEFCGKIKAAKDTQSDPDFCLVARIEAFIAGLGLEEALKRATAYADAGADAILVHSKLATSTDIDQFMAHWNRETPIVIVPTKYYSVPTEHFKKLGISMAIWANHSVRSATKAMQETMKTIYEDQHLKNVENAIVPVSELFRLQGAKELQLAEKDYLPDNSEQKQVLILAAGASKLGDLTETIPKAMLPVRGTSILDRQIEVFRKFQLKNITVVRGHNKEAINQDGITKVDNDDYKDSYEVYSLYLAQQSLASATVISYGDILFKDYFIHECLNQTEDIVIVVDAASKKSGSQRDLVRSTAAYDATYFNQKTTLVEMVKREEESQQDDTDIHGEFVGVIHCSEAGAASIKHCLNSIPEEELKTMRMHDFLNRVTQVSPIHIAYVQGGWIDVNTLVDLQSAGNFYA